MENNNINNKSETLTNNLINKENINPTPINLSSSQMAKNTKTQNSNIDSDDLKKAIIFLLGKELKDYSIEKKREYLSKKISAETLEKAMELYPIIESNTNAKIEDFIKDYEAKNTKNSFFDGLFDLGSLTTVIISTLGINYLVDLQRNKKNEIFYKESEKKLNDELSKLTEIMKKDIANELNNFCKKSEVEEKIKEKFTLQNQNAGLTLNLGSKNIKENINLLKNEMSTQEQKLKEMSVKLDNSGVILKQDILKEIKDLIEVNNKNLLMNIIEIQNKLLVNNSFNNPDPNVIDQNAILNKSKQETLNKQEDNFINFKTNNSLSNTTGLQTSFVKNLEIKKNNLDNQNEIKADKTTKYLLPSQINSENINDIRIFKSDIANKDEINTTSKITFFDESQKENNVEIKDGNYSNPIMVKKSNLNNILDFNSKLNIEDITTSTIITESNTAANYQENQQEVQKEIKFENSFEKILKTLDENKKKNFILQIKVITLESFFFILNLINILFI